MILKNKYWRFQKINIGIFQKIYILRFFKIYIGRFLENIYWKILKNIYKIKFFQLKILQKISVTIKDLLV